MMGFISRCVILYSRVCSEGIIFLIFKRLTDNHVNLNLQLSELNPSGIAYEFKFINDIDL